MHTMSKAATREYILRKQEDYIGELDRRRRGRILDEVCRMTGLERKYASRLLKGSRTSARAKAGAGLHIQVDSVAFCGGFAEGDYFWAATATDVRTQWFEARPSYNLNAANYAPAFRGNLEAFPFPVTGIHSDNGPELVNAVIYRYETGRWPKAKLGRSWPGRKNHNAHIEQKNGSVLRTFVGDVRLAHPGLRRSFERLLEAICLYNNYFRPCVMLTSKSKRRDGSPTPPPALGGFFT